MSNLQQILLTLASVSQQLVTQQIVLSNALAKDIAGVPEDLRQTFLKSAKDDWKRLELLGEVGSLIAHVS